MATGKEPVRAKDPEVAFLLEGIPVIKFRPEDYVRKPLRPRWSSSTDFIFACLVFSVGLGNLQFPFLCHKNGGGTVCKLKKISSNFIQKQFIDIFSCIFNSLFSCLNLDSRSIGGIRNCTGALNAERLFDCLEFNTNI